MSRHLGFVAVLAVIVLAAACVPAQAVNVSYAAREGQIGGWDYAYTGDAAAAESSAAAGDALDGSWTATCSSSAWDGTAPGAGQPGGVGAYSQSGVNFTRIQDAGDPGDHTGASPDNGNMYFGRELSSDTSLLDNGVTLSFRARVPMTVADDGGVLDPWYMDSGSSYWTGAGNTLPWPPLADIDRYGGAGNIVGSGGKANFGIWQKDGLNDEGYQYGKLISFGLSVDDGVHFDAFRGTSTPVPVVNGLNMNSRASGILGNQPCDSVDVDQYEGSLNLLPIAAADMSDWHEFWITITPVTTPLATHRVDVWVDGATTPTVFFVTAGDSGQEPDFAKDLFSGGSVFYDNAMTLGFVGSRQPGALDVDFYAAKAGAYGVPEPSTFVLLGIAALCGLLIRKWR